MGPLDKVGRDPEDLGAQEPVGEPEGEKKGRA